MKVYHPGGRGHLVMVTPGATIQGEIPSDWQNGDGTPRRFDVRFDTNGVAEVDKKLGEYLIEKGYAQRTALKRVFNKLLPA